MKRGKEKNFFSFVRRLTYSCYVYFSMQNEAKTAGRAIEGGGGDKSIIGGIKKWSMKSFII
jgi:hypothetical protein